MAKIRPTVIGRFVSKIVVLGPLTKKIGRSPQAQVLPEEWMTRVFARAFLGPKSVTLGSFWHPRPGNNYYPEVLTETLRKAPACLALHATPIFIGFAGFRGLLISNRTGKTSNIRQTRFLTGWSKNSKFQEIGRYDRRNRRCAPIFASNN